MSASLAARVITLDDFKTVLSEVAALTGQSNFIVVGTSTLAVSRPDCDPSFLVTRDIDIYSASGDLSHRHDVAAKLGLNSEFYRANGIYVQFLDDRCNQCLPDGWEKRAIPFEHNGAIALCISPVDIALNKLQAGRPKDYPFVGKMIAFNVVTEAELIDGARAVSSKMPEEGEKQAYGD